MSNKLIYRGYDLEEVQPGKWIIRLAGKELTTAIGSEDAAASWVDNHKKTQGAAS
jgi:hypothetical protein